MSINPEFLARVYIVLFLIGFVTVMYGVYQQVLFVRKQRRDLLQNYQESDNATTSEFMDFKFRNKLQDIQEILKIKGLIKSINTEQTVHNRNLVTPSNITFIVVIQVHSSVYYLRELLMSLSGANGIDRALLIFSHDVFSSQINKLIKKVTFAQYMQIFYPYSIQLHPSVFPGKDDQFCIEGYVCKTSDLRDPEAAQMKHHWWWGANQVFDNIDITQNYNGTILFLEEGDYVTEDVLYVTTLLRHARMQHCSFCEVLSLGAHKPKLAQYSKKSLISVEVWNKRIPRTGIAFNRHIWNALKSNSDVFCKYNDFNWDSTFRYVAEQKWEGNVYMTAIGGPRVFRLGQCNVQEDIFNMTCKEHELSKVDQFIKHVTKNFYPWGMIMVVYKEEIIEEKPAGLWGDIRDHDLCLHFSKKSTWF